MHSVRVCVCRRRTPGAAGLGRRPGQGQRTARPGAERAACEGTAPLLWGAAGCPGQGGDPGLPGKFTQWGSMGLKPHKEPCLSSLHGAAGAGGGPTALVVGVGRTGTHDPQTANGNQDTWTAQQPSRQRPCVGSGSQRGDGGQVWRRWGAARPEMGRQRPRGRATCGRHWPDGWSGWGRER